jgi:hypothetical protein
MSRRPPSALFSRASLWHLPLSMPSPHDSPCSTRRVYLLLYLNALRRGSDQLSLMIDLSCRLDLVSRTDAHVVECVFPFIAEDTELSLPFAVYLMRALTLKF